MIRSGPSGGICASGNEHAPGLLNISIKKFLKSTSRWRYGCNYSLSQSLIYLTFTSHVLCVRQGLNLVQCEVHFHKGVFLSMECAVIQKQGRDLHTKFQLVESVSFHPSHTRTYPYTREFMPKHRGMMSYIKKSTSKYHQA